MQMLSQEDVPIADRQERFLNSDNVASTLLIGRSPVYQLLTNVDLRSARIGKSGRILESWLFLYLCQNVTLKI